MITTFTKEHEEKSKEYVERWTKVYLSTNTDVAQAEKFAKAEYERRGLQCPRIVWANSPIAGAKIVMEELVKAKVCKKAEAKQIALNDACYGSHDAPWLAYHEFFYNEYKPEDGPENEKADREKIQEDISQLLVVMELSKHVGWYWLYDTLCVLTYKPIVIAIKDKQFHRDRGPAIEYRDGFGIYRLNGIEVPEKFVKAAPEDISVAEIMKEQNVDVRRELLRKIGLERFIKDTKAVTIDTMILSTPKQSWPQKLLSAFKAKTNAEPNVFVKEEIEYKLLDISLGGGIMARVLQMENPSIDAIHVEGVEDDCKTVKEALAWRLGLDKYTDLSALS